MSQKNKLVSGPINVVRLEGNIFSIDKILYVFFDLHMPCQFETICEDIFSEPITQYLVKEFQKINEKDLTYDFFLETFPTGFQYTNNYRNIYLNDLRRFVASAVTYDPKSDKVSPSKIFPKVRLHYIDIRDYLFWDILWTQMEELISIAQQGYDVYNLQILIEKLQNQLESIDMIDKLFFGQSGGKRLIQEFGAANFGKNKIVNIIALIDKIKNNYKHKEVQKIVQMMLNNYLKEGLLAAKNKIIEIIKLTDKLIKIKSKPQNELNLYEDPFDKDLPDFCKSLGYGPQSDGNLIYDYIMRLINQLDNICRRSSSIIVDAYFIRRFLDKDYVTNAISYTGAAHSQMYIYILTKYFDFKVTHASYSKYDIPTLNNKLKDVSLGYELIKLFSREKLIQCSNLTDFPENFK